VRPAEVLIVSPANRVLDVLAIIRAGGVVTAFGHQAGPQVGLGLYGFDLAHDVEDEPVVRSGGHGERLSSPSDGVILAQVRIHRQTGAVGGKRRASMITAKTRRTRGKPGGAFPDRTPSCPGS